MNTSTSSKVESSQDEIPDCEWHTKDPITGELFYLSKGILYSKLPSNSAQRIISINPKEIIPEEEFPKNKVKSIYLSNSAKFSSVYKGNKVQIFGGQSIANCSSQNESAPNENFAIVTNIIPIVPATPKHEPRAYENTQHMRNTSKRNRCGVIRPRPYFTKMAIVPLALHTAETAPIKKSVPTTTIDSFAPSRDILAMLARE